MLRPEPYEHYFFHYIIQKCLFVMNLCIMARKSNFGDKNPNNQLKMCLRFSTLLHSYSLASLASIPCYVIEKLDQLTVKRTNNKKKNGGLTVSGKKRQTLSSGAVEYVTDDLAISVIMATMMFDDIKTQRTDFITLQGQLCQFL